MNKEISIKQYIILRSLQRFRMEWECSHAVGGWSWELSQAKKRYKDERIELTYNKLN